MSDAVSRKALIELLEAEMKDGDETWAGAMKWVAYQVETGHIPSIPSSAEERYRTALDHCLTGGNSLSSAIIGWMLPAGYEKWSKEEAISYFYDQFDRDEAYEKYEIWLCWKSLMEARDTVESISPSGEHKESPREALEQAIRDYDIIQGRDSAKSLIAWLESVTSFVYDKEDGE